MDDSDGVGTGRIVAIAHDDTWAHVYPTINVLRMHDDTESAPLGAMEFFDPAGARLACQFDPHWRLVALHPAGDPDPGRLQGRARTVVRHLDDYLRKHPEVAKSIPNLPDDIGDRLRKLAESDLDTILVAIELPGQVRPLDSGGWFHNALHKAGWDHD